MTKNQHTKRLLLLMPATTYRAADFMGAAHRLGAEVVVGSNLPQILETFSGGRTVTLDFDHPERAIEQIRSVPPFDAIVPVDEEGTLLAATLAVALTLRHNSIEAVEASRDKSIARRLLRDAGLPVPRFEVLPIDQDPGPAGERVGFPCVVKPLVLAASQGVIRADDLASLRGAVKRVAAILADRKIQQRGPAARKILIERFIPGREFALEGLLRDGKLEVLALFDKPDPLDGPFFEETLYVTPSRLPDSAQAEIALCVARATAALGLSHGPIHAEVRLNEQGPWILEVAARSIGGLCSRTLRFGTGLTLEEIIVRHALGMDIPSLERERRAAGVMMIPIPKAGTLRDVLGKDEAKAVPGIEAVTIMIRRGQSVVPLPEGKRYLGFIFARGERPEVVEAALREAHRRLVFEITP
ncbi:MAG: ATP-grasp domain-containing protein [Nitrospirae bacterium]|nr:ATP-grasp domain-containing protein [Nitrospirota bacterium]